jgi:ACDE family multidrug resistance protein
MEARKKWDLISIASIPLSMTLAASAGVGAVLPSMDAFVTEGIDKKQRGTVSSLFSSMRFIGVAVGPPISALLLRGSMSTLFFVIASTGLAGAHIAAFAIRPEHKTG